MTVLLHPEKRGAAAGNDGAAPGQSPGDGWVADLDDLRLALMTDLSHQLRTPVTAMRLALDGLLSELDPDADVRHNELAEVTRRNLDRIMAIVDRQLELLGMALGYGSVSLETVSIAGVIDMVRMGLAPADVAVTAVCDDDVTACTDPARLAALLTGLLADGPPAARRRIDVHATRTRCVIDVRVDFLAGDLAPAASPALPAPATDFERRACEAAVTALGGEMELRKDADAKCARILLPLRRD